MPSGKQTALKRSRTPEECAAVERHLRKFIEVNQVSGNMDRQQYIAAEPEALGRQDWEEIKRC